MLPEAVQNRVRRLIAVELREREQELPATLGRISNEFAARGTFHSSMRCQAVHAAIEREFTTRAQLTWNCMQRAHETIGVQPDADLAAALRSFMKAQLARTYEGLEQVLTREIRITNEGMRRQLTLAGAYHRLQDKFDVEIDLYVDALTARAGQGHGGTAAAITVHGPVGAIVTGSGAVAHVVQHLSPNDRDALIEAIATVRDAIESATELGDRRAELVDVAEEVVSIIQSERPNNAKLWGLLNVLAISVQTLASAGPAYQAIKAAVLPLGLHLP